MKKNSSGPYYRVLWECLKRGKNAKNFEDVSPACFLYGHVLKHDDSIVKEEIQLYERRMYIFLQK